MKTKPRLIENFAIIIFFLIIIFFTFPKLKELVQSITDPCSKTQTFSIERIDSEFGIATSTVSTYLNEASALWNKAYPNNILLEQIPTGGDISISFIYDERQRTTIKNARLDRQITEQKAKLTTLKNTITELQTTYNTQEEILSSLENDYTTRLSAYNKSVTALNTGRKKPSPETLSQLKSDRQYLDEELININAKIVDLNNLTTQISNYSNTHNNVVTDTNTIVNKINEQSGKSFEEGLYEQSKNAITIYEYNSVSGLKRVLAHELGHAIGINHVLGKASIMYPYNDSKLFTLSTEDKSALKIKCEGFSWKTINLSKYITWFVK